MVSTSKYNSVVAGLDRPLPTWVTDIGDQLRVAAYDGYDDMYRNVPGTFKVVLRGDDEDHAIYVPSARRIIEATNRYLGKEWNWSVSSVNPDAAVGEAQRIEVETAFSALFIREEVPSKFYGVKRTMLVKGDALWHITADLTRVAGQRITVAELDPRTFFRIPSPTNVENMVGVYIVDLIFADDGKTQIARRQEYRYNESGGVDTLLTFWEPNAWDDRWTGHPPLKPVEPPTAYAEDPAMQALLGGYTLPNSIVTIPVYHIRNQREGGDPFGTSQLAGLETLIGAINQTVSDEDITLALQGLGLYVTDSTRPVDADGAETDWIVAPGYVLEAKPGTKFERVSGVTTVVPFQDHLGYIDKKLDQSANLSATAVGNVDVQVAASGVALRLDMAPILAANEEKEIELLSKMDQMTFDLLTQWMPLEGVSVAPGLKVINSFNDPLPVDRAAVITEVTGLVTAGLMSRDFAIKYLTAKLGYQFPADMLLQILSEEDNVATRLAAEVAGGAVPTDAGAGDISAGGAGTTDVPGAAPVPVGTPA
jgi:hypothetical protein